VLSAGWPECATGRPVESLVHACRAMTVSRSPDIVVGHSEAGEEHRTEDVGRPELPQANIALESFRAALLAGEQWFPALLEAIRLWDRTEEVYEGRHYRYLIGGEALDWLLLAERLTCEVQNLIPQEELEELLFAGRPPQPIDRETFRRSIGPAKFRSYLNYFYGVTVEEALLLAAEEEILKESAGVFHRVRTGEDAYQRIYGSSLRELLAEFGAERGIDPAQPLPFAEYKEFTYWLFKRRVRTHHPARVASDTKKGLEALIRHRRELDIPWPTLDALETAEGAASLDHGDVSAGRCSTNGEAPDAG
jgi:hypothetical protein